MTPLNLGHQCDTVISVQYSLRKQRIIFLMLPFMGKKMPLMVSRMVSLLLQGIPGHVVLTSQIEL